MFIAADAHWEAQEVRRQLARRRHELAAAWNLDDEVVLVGAGAPVTIPGRGDPSYPFRAHLEYLYLTDRERPHGVLAFDPREGWVDFVAPVSRLERLWEGGDELELDGTVPVDELAGWLAGRGGRPVACLGAPVDACPAADVGLARQLRTSLNAIRRVKDELELERMRVAERRTPAGFCVLVSRIEQRAHSSEQQKATDADMLRP